MERTFELYGLKTDTFKQYAEAIDDMKLTLDLWGAIIKAADRGHKGVKADWLKHDETGIQEEAIYLTPIYKEARQAIRMDGPEVWNAHLLCKSSLAEQFVSVFPWTTYMRKGRPTGQDMAAKMRKRFLKVSP